MGKYKAGRNKGHILPTYLMGVGAVTIACTLLYFASTIITSNIDKNRERKRAEKSRIEKQADEDYQTEVRLHFLDALECSDRDGNRQLSFEEFDSYLNATFGDGK